MDSFIILIGCLFGTFLVIGGSMVLNHIRWKKIWSDSEVTKATVSHVDCGIIYVAEPISGTNSTTGILLDAFSEKYPPAPKDVIEVAVQKGCVIAAKMYQSGGGYLNQGSI